MLTGIPCYYSAWGECIIRDQENLPAITDNFAPLEVTGINPTERHQRGYTDDQKETKFKFKRRVTIIQKQTMEYDSPITGGVKGKSIKAGVKNFSNVMPALKVNHTPLDHSKSGKMCYMNNGVSEKPKGSIAFFNHAQLFQPCITCKQIIERREKLFTRFQLDSESFTPQASQVTTQLSSVFEPEQPVSSEDGTSVHEEEVTHSKLMKGSRSDTCSLLNAKPKSKPCVEKSSLLKSKERIEKLLQIKQKQLQYLLSKDDYIDLRSETSVLPDTSASVSHNSNESCSSSDHVSSHSMIAPQPPAMRRLTQMLARSARLTDYNEPVEQPMSVGSPHSTEYVPPPTAMVKSRRGAFQNNRYLMPIPKHDNFMRILQKSLPNKDGIVLWINLACISLRVYQVELIRAFVYNLGISYWRLRYLVPKSASILTNSCWVQIESLCFNVMITPHNKTVEFSVFSSVTSANLGSKGIIRSKDPDLLLHELTPIPNALSPLEDSLKEQQVTIVIGNKVIHPRYSSQLD